MSWFTVPTDPSLAYFYSHESGICMHGLMLPSGSLTISETRLPWADMTKLVEGGNIVPATGGEIFRLFPRFYEAVVSQGGRPGKPPQLPDQPITEIEGGAW